MKQKGKLVEDFKDCEQSPQVSIMQMEEYNNNSIDVLWSEKICKSFGLLLDRGLIRRTLGYREQTRDPRTPRVSVSELAISICKQVGMTPDEKLMGTANKMHGEGSRHSLTTQACCKVLREKFGMKEEY